MHTILEDSGAVSLVGRKGTNYESFQGGVEEPLEKLFQMARAVCVFLPNQRTAGLGVILSLLVCKLHQVSCLPHFVPRGFTQDEKIIDIRTKCKTD